ncbi:MAG: hypothetical protein Q8R00_04665 [Candidatus Nanoarchaeia archaeon]|nr:hypothetical protein [Candidatus Nanoarchaeia archaeon]
MKFLNKRQVKRLLNQIKEQYGIKKLKIEDYIHVIKSRFYLISKDIEKINFDELNIRSAGLYFGAIEKEKFVPSEEGRQLLEQYL